MVWGSSVLLKGKATPVLKRTITLYLMEQLLLYTSQMFFDEAGKVQ
jgi:hypothetical protein